jgi:glycosyltransferase involved in cell wall biosynthesis
LRKAYGDAGRQRVAEHFGVDRLVEGTLSVYERLTSR